MTHKYVCERCKMVCVRFDCPNEFKRDVCSKCVTKIPVKDFYGRIVNISEGY